MRHTGVVAVLVVGFALLVPKPAGAANKEQQLLMAELRILQQHQQQVEQMLLGLTETLKTITTKIDDQSGVTRKAFADQKLLIDNVVETASILRERADDTNVRLSSMAQELQSLRQAVASMPPSAPMPSPTGADPSTGDPVAPATGTAPANASGPPPNISPTAMWNRVYADYTGGQYDLAISGFEAFIRTFPTSPQADDAQLYIGNSLYNAGRFQEAVAALQKVISDYPQGDTGSQALHKLGLSYEQLKQVDLARKAFETVIQKYPHSKEVILSQQALERLKRRDERD